MVRVAAEPHPPIKASTEPNPPSGELQLTTFTLGNLLVHIFTSTQVDMIETYRSYIGGAANSWKLKQLWPVAGDPMDWPPRTPFIDDEVDRLAFDWIENEWGIRALPGQAQTRRILRAAEALVDRRRRRVKRRQVVRSVSGPRPRCTRDMAMAKIVGYALLMARAKAQQEQRKPFLRKPYVTYGQTCVMLGYFFQVGLVLAEKHRNKLEAFGRAFLGAYGPPGALKQYFAETVTDNELAKEAQSFTQYIQAEQARRFNYSGDPTVFFMEHAQDRLGVGAAADLAWQLAQQGAAIGALRHEMARPMFDLTYVVDDEVWKSARAAGLDIPAEPNFLSFDTVQDNENALFLDYCRNCCPESFPILSSA